MIVTDFYKIRRAGCGQSGVFGKETPAAPEAPQHQRAVERAGPFGNVRGRWGAPGRASPHGPAAPLTWRSPLSPLIGCLPPRPRLLIGWLRRPPRALLVSARYLEGSEERLPLPPPLLSPRSHWRQSRRAGPAHWLLGRPRARIGGRLRGAPPRGGQSGAFGLESCRRRSAARGCGRREPGARCCRLGSAERGMAAPG